MDPLEDDDSLSRRRFLVGTVGAAAVASSSSTALAQDDEEGGGEGNESDGGDGGDDNESGGGEGEDNESDGGGGGGTEEVIVGPGGDTSFEPDELTIEPGTTVVWTWDSDNHNIHPDDTDAWEGHQDIENEGFEYEHTFEEENEHHYVCDPHVSAGMEGDVIVGEDAAAGGGGPQQTVPDAAWTLLIGTVAGMISTLSLVYFFMRYGGPTGE